MTRGNPPLPPEQPEQRSQPQRSQRQSPPPPAEPPIQPEADGDVPGAPQVTAQEVIDFIHRRDPQLVELAVVSIRMVRAEEELAAMDGGRSTDHD